MEVVIVVLAVAGIVLFCSMKKVKPGQRAIVERLGRPLPGVRAPGRLFVVPFIDRLRFVSSERERIDVSEVDVTSLDNRLFRIDLAIDIEVVDPVKASHEVSDYREATAELARTSACAAAVERTPSPNVFERDALAQMIRERMIPAMTSWGLRVEKLDVKVVHWQ